MKKKEEDNSNDIQVDIGQIYREAREAANISLKEAHFSTQLSIAVLENIESNQFAEIGASVYVRGYLGLYAKYLGLDHKHILSIFEAQNASTPIEIRPSLAQSQPIGSRKLKSKRHSKTLSTLVLLVVLAGLGYGYYLFKPLLFPDLPAASEETQTPTETETAPPPATDSLDNLLTEADATLNSANEVISTSSTASDSLTQEVEVDINSFLAEGARVNGSETEAQSTLPDTEQTETTAAVELESTAQVAEQTEGETASAPTAPDTTGPKTLAINFTQDCWVKITDSENNVLTSRLYRKGSDLSVSGLPPFAIVIGNQDGLGVTTYDGESISLLDFKTGNISYTLN